VVDLVVDLFTRGAAGDGEKKKKEGKVRNLTSIDLCSL
jgi:hypothetical protein